MGVRHEAFRSTRKLVARKEGKRLWEERFRGLGKMNNDEETGKINTQHETTNVQFSWSTDGRKPRWKSGLQCRVKGKTFRLEKEKNRASRGRRPPMDRDAAVTSIKWTGRQRGDTYSERVLAGDGVWMKRRMKRLAYIGPLKGGDGNGMANGCQSTSSSNIKHAPEPIIPHKTIYFLLLAANSRWVAECCYETCWSNAVHGRIPS